MLRRSFILGATIGLAVGLCPHCSYARARVNARGCRLLGATAGGSDDVPKLLTSSGEQGIDIFCRSQVDSLNTVFGVRATFGFYDDAGIPNALALSEQYDKVNPDGTVLMGISLAKTILSTLAGTNNLLVLNGVMAHEWGHILQYQIGYTDDWLVRYELSADYMVGWYFNRAQSANKNLRSEILTLFSRFSKLGDTEFTNPNHHGTPTQRSKILVEGAGYTWRDQKIGKNAYTYNHIASTAKEAFENAINSLVPDL